MGCELQPIGQNESGLFYRLDGEAAERHGAIGYMRADFGKSGQEFWTTWFDNQRHLKTPAFQEHFKLLMNLLRTEMFEDRPAMRLWCNGDYGVSLGERGTGFRLNRGDYTYYLRCNPGQSDYDAYMFAYDNRYLLPELAWQHDTPQGCYSVKPSTGEIILIRRGETGYSPIAYQTESRVLNRLFVNEKNAEIGVTRAQEEAMLAGSVFGWHTTAAKPWNYEPDGTPRKPPKDRNRESER